MNEPQELVEQEAYVWGHPRQFSNLIGYPLATILEIFEGVGSQAIKNMMYDSLEDMRKNLPQ